MKKIIFGILILFLAATVGYSQESALPLQVNIKTDKPAYKIGEKIVVRVEFKNVSSEPIKLFDFQDHPPEAKNVSASYLRGMVLGFNEGPIPYHIPTTSIEKYITLEPGAVYSFEQDYNCSVKLTAKPAFKKLKVIYDTKIFVEGHWKGDYWKGRLESNEISLGIEEK